VFNGCSSGHPVLRSTGVSVRAATFRACAKCRDCVLPESHPGRHRSAWLEPDLQQPHSARPQLAGAFSISKTTPLLNVTRGQLVPYTITISNAIGASLQGEQVVDRYPAGFRYVPGSARLDGVPSEPKVAAGQLVWNGLNFGSSTRMIVLLLGVGAGVGEGEFVNRAQVVDGLTGSPCPARRRQGFVSSQIRLSIAQTCSARSSNDVNRNGVQDDGEDGLPGVRVVTARVWKRRRISTGVFTSPARSRQTRVAAAISC